VKPQRGLLTSRFPSCLFQFPVHSIYVARGPTTQFQSMSATAVLPVHRPGHPHLKLKMNMSPSPDHPAWPMNMLSSLNMSSSATSIQLAGLPQQRFCADCRERDPWLSSSCQSRHLGCVGDGNSAVGGISKSSLDATEDTGWAQMTGSSSYSDIS
jgi:hypothetical protein